MQGVITDETVQAGLLSACHWALEPEGQELASKAKDLQKIRVAFRDQHKGIKHLALRLVLKQS